MATVMTSTSNYSSTHVDVALEKRVLEIGEKRKFAEEFADKGTQPSGTGRTKRWLRAERLDIPLAALSEAIDPESTSSAINVIEATASQFGLVCVISDRNLFESAVDLLKLHADLMADAMMSSREQVIQDTLLSGTNVFYAGTGNTSRADLAAGDVLSSDEIFIALNALTTTDSVAGGAPKFEGGMYKAIVHDRQMYDLRQDERFVANINNQPSQLKESINSQVERLDWLGVRIYASNWMHEFSNAGAFSGAVASEGTGTLANGTYTFVIVGKHKKRGFAEKRYQADTAASSGNDSINVTAPSDTDYVYDIYATVADGAEATARLQTSNVEASSVTNYAATISTDGALVPVLPASGVKVYPAYFFGKGAYGVTELKGKTSSPSVKVIDEYSHSNPLNLRVTLSAKWDFASVILNDNFLVRVESTSSLS